MIFCFGLVCSWNICFLKHPIVIEENKKYSELNGINNDFKHVDSYSQKENINSSISYIYLLCNDLIIYVFFV